MLKLTRKIGEKVVLETPDGTAIEVKVGQLDRNRVELMFTAPREVQIYRGEVYQRRLAEGAKF